MNTLYNLAVMLDTHCERKIEAEALYRRTLQEEPAHTFALYNLAVLLEERMEIEPIIMSDSIKSNNSEASTIMPDIRHADVRLLDSSSPVKDLTGVNAIESYASQDFTNATNCLKERDALIMEITSLHEQAMHLNPSDVSTIADYGRCDNNSFFFHVVAIHE